MLGLDLLWDESLKKLRCRLAAFHWCSFLINERCFWTTAFAGIKGKRDLLSTEEDSPMDDLVLTNREIALSNKYMNGYLLLQL